MKCLTPYNVKNDRKFLNDFSYIPVPCGKCPNCYKKRIDHWVLRLVNEEKVSMSSTFVTLTYSEEALPINDSGVPTLFKPDVQKFFKRLRKKHSSKIKYYLCGEYGTKTKRPHYHALIFNARNDLIDETWDYGDTHHGDVTKDSIAYTLKYMQKSNKKFTDKQSEFSLMSKGLGLGYLKDNMIKYHKENMIPYATLEGGAKISLPRYYKDRIFTESEKMKLNHEFIVSEAQKLEQAIKEHGSLENHMKINHYRINQSIYNFKKRVKNERTKI